MKAPTIFENLILFFLFMQLNFDGYHWLSILFAAVWLILSVAATEANPYGDADEKQ